MSAAPQGPSTAKEPLLRTSQLSLSSLLCTLAASALLLTASTASAQFRGGITVFTDPDFRGESASFRDDTPDLVTYELNDKISSIRLSPGESWEVCRTSTL